jgi:hypothetical protein
MNRSILKRRVLSSPFWVRILKSPRFSLATGFLKPDFRSFHYEKNLAKAGFSEGMYQVTAWVSQRSPEEWHFRASGQMRSVYRGNLPRTAENPLPLIGIILGNRGPMTGDEFRSLIAALDTSSVDGYAAVDGVGRIALRLTIDDGEGTPHTLTPTASTRREQSLDTTPTETPVTASCGPATAPSPPSIPRAPHTPRPAASTRRGRSRETIIQTSITASCGLATVPSPHSISRSRARARDPKAPTLLPSTRRGRSRDITMTQTSMFTASCGSPPTQMNDAEGFGGSDKHEVDPA